MRSRSGASRGQGRFETLNRAWAGASIRRLTTKVSGIQCALLKESSEGFLGLLDAFVGQPLQLAEVPRGNGAGCQVFAGPAAALIEQVVQLVHVPASVGEVGEPVEGVLVAGVGEFTEHVAIGLAEGPLGLGL